MDDKPASKRNLTLERPLVFIDIQTTGLDVRTARIVRIATLRIEPDGSERFRIAMVNPMMPISPGASEIHGITDEQVADAPEFTSYARALAEYLTGCDFAGFGIRRYHLRVLENEFRNAGVTSDCDEVAIVDAMEVFHKLEPRDMAAAYARYVGGNYEMPSNPETSINAVREIIRGQMESSSDVPEMPRALDDWITGKDQLHSIDAAGRFVWSEAGDPIINFGKYKGHTLYDMAEQYPDYLIWVANNDSFTEEQRQIAMNAANGIMPDLE